MAIQTSVKCGICLETAHDDEKETWSVLLTCGHVFHSNCIELALQSQKPSVCPFCKVSALTSATQSSQDSKSPTVALSTHAARLANERACFCRSLPSCGRTPRRRAGGSATSASSYPWTARPTAGAPRRPRPAPGPASAQRISTPKSARHAASGFNLLSDTFSALAVSLLQGRL